MGDNDNTAGFAALDEMIRRCRTMPGMAEREAPRVAEMLEKVIAKAVAKGTSPEGQAWAPTQDGHPPLRGAMSAITVEPTSDGVIATVTGHHVFHQRGTKSRGANKAARKAGSARKAARSAAREQRHVEKSIARAAEKAAAAPTERRRKTWEKKLAEHKATLKATKSKARGAAMHAEAATTVAKAAASSGGLPARPMIPVGMPGTLTEETRKLFKERWEAHMRGAA